MSGLGFRKHLSQQPAVASLVECNVDADLYLISKAK